jgi:hypothetical protein
MPIRATTAPHSGTTRHSTIILPAETGILRAVTLMQDQGQISAFSRGAAEYWAAIYISSQDLPRPVPLIWLAEGRLGSYNAVFWTGHIATEPAMIVVASITGTADSAFSLRLKCED